MSIRESLVPVERLRLPEGGVRRLDVSADQAGSIAALAIDATLVVFTSAITGIAYQRVALGINGDLTVLLGTGAVVAACFCAFTRIVDVADPLRVSSGVGRARTAITAWISTFLFLMLIAFALKIGAVFSRGAVFSFFLVGLGVVVASRVLVPRLLARWTTAFAFRGAEAIVIGAGDEPDASALVSELRRNGCTAVHVIRIDGNCDGAAWPSERKRAIDQTLAIARAARPGAIYVDAAAVNGERLASVVSGLRIVPRSVRVVPESSVAALLKYSVRTIGSSIALEMQREPLTRVQRTAKRAIDIALSSLALLLLSPVLVLVAALVKLDSPGPVMFRQMRNGLGGKPFRIFKFRTMAVMEDGPDVSQAVRGDFRVTRTGRFLRSTSLDELPQFLNVLIGEMSLVGPRPHARSHDEHYATLVENYQVRQHVKPGLTGWAQVSGYRGETPTVDLMHDRIECDLWYAANASLSLDFLILLRTLPALIGHRNAY